MLKAFEWLDSTTEELGRWPTMVDVGDGRLIGGDEFRDVMA